MNRRVLAALILDAAVWTVAVWLMTARLDQPLAPQFWHHLARVSYGLAGYLGAVGLAAEAQYWKAVRS